MIDIHAHILPGIDDGAEDMYEALEMARMAVSSGMRAIVATPHCNIPGVFDNYYGEEYIAKFLELERALANANIPLTLYAGMEVFMNSDVPKLLADGKLQTINGSNYMLTEFAFDEEPGYMFEMLKTLKELGIRPIIAHPERYYCVQDDPEIVYHWRKNGYLIQVNKGSLQGRFGKQSYYASHNLMEHNLVSVIASDCHSPFQRTPYMLDIYEELSNVYSRQILDTLMRENPLRICKNQPTIRFELKPFEEEEW